MDTFSLFYQFVTTFSFLVLSTVGLAVIFGVMNIINFAHASFIMLGAVFTVLIVDRFGLPLLAAMLLAVAAVAVIGAIVERLVIRLLYRRILDCLLATWAINMGITQLVFITLGSSQPSVQVPFGSFTVGGLSYATYNLVVAAASVAVLAFLYILLRHTDFGLRVRASMENKDMAEGLGTPTTRLHLMTFTLGAALGGLAGALYAPLMPVSPFFGDRFLWRAFTVIIVGGPDPLVGPILSSAALGLVYSSLNWVWGTIVGSIGMLLTTMIFIRLFPTGFSGLLQNYRKSRGQS